MSTRSPFDQQSPPGPEADAWFQQNVIPILSDLQRLARRIADTSDEARVLEQEALIRLWLKGHTNYDPMKGSLLTYASQIMRNRKTSLHRSEKLRASREVPLDEGMV